MKKLVFLAALAASFLAHAESVRLPEYAQVEARAAELSAALAEVKTAIDNQPAPDLSGIEPKLDEIKTAIESQPAPDFDLSPLDEKFESVNGGISGLEAKIDTLRALSGGDQYDLAMAHLQDLAPGETMTECIKNAKAGVKRSYVMLDKIGADLPVVQDFANMPVAISSLSTKDVPLMQNLASVKFVFNASGSGYIPENPDTLNALLEGARVRLMVGGTEYTYAIPAISEGTVIQGLVGCSDEKAVSWDVRFGNADERVCVAHGSAVFKGGKEYTVNLDTYLVRDETIEIGRLQRIEAQSAESFLITREGDGEGHVTTKFGHFNKVGTVSTWASDTELTVFIPELNRTTGEIEKDYPAERTDFEAKAWPWNAMRPVDMVINHPTMTDEQKTLKMVECPIFYTKVETNTLDFVTIDANGVRTSNPTLCEIKWVCKTKLPGYILPSYEKIWKLVDNGDGTFTKKWTPKAANYYARYKSANVTVGGITFAQSREHAGTNSGQYRSDADNRAKKLNGYPVTFNGSSVFADGTTLDATSDVIRFAGNGWLEYEPWRYLAYIEFGVDPQAHMLGITSNNNSNGDLGKLNSLAACFAAHPEIPTFSGGIASSSAPISTWWILNFWGSEGDHMCDATAFYHRDAENNTRAFVMCNLDRDRWDPDGTSYTDMLDQGYEALDYAMAATGKTSWKNLRGYDSRECYQAFQFPTTSDEVGMKRAIVLGSTGTYVDDWWAGSFLAGTDTYNPFIASLSTLGSNARSLGLWSVFAFYAPRYGNVPNANSWGSRLSACFPQAEANGEGAPVWYDVEIENLDQTK